MLKDFQPLCTVGEGQALTADGQARYESRAVTFLRGAVQQARPAGQAVLKDPGASNVHQAQALDHSLMGAFRFDLLAFRAAEPLGPLRRHEKRFWVPADQLPAALRQTLQGRTRRSCVLHATQQSTRLEVKRQETRFVLHEFIDMGPQSWPIRAAMYTSWSLRGTWSNDPAHRRYDDFLLSAGRAGLHMLRLERGVGRPRRAITLSGASESTGMGLGCACRRTSGGRSVPLAFAGASALAHQDCVCAYEAKHDGDVLAVNMDTMRSSCLCRTCTCCHRFALPF